MRKEIEAYEGYYKDILHTGSRVICDPAPKDTDDDYLLLSWEGAVDALVEKLSSDAYIQGGSLGNGFPGHSGNGFSSGDLTVQDWSDGFDGIDYNRVFRSFKKDDVNVIVTIDPAYFKKFSLATGIARRLNLLEKEDRVALFETMVRDVQHPLEDKNYYRKILAANAVEWLRHNGVAGQDVIMNNEALVDHLNNAPIRVVDEINPNAAEFEIN